MARTPKKKTAKKSTAASSDGAADDDLATLMDNATIHDKPHPYSFDQKDSYFVKHYCHKNKNLVEVDFFAGACYDRCFYQVGLAKSGHVMRYQKATPVMFGETGHLKKVMGDKWHEDDHSCHWP